MTDAEADVLLKTNLLVQEIWDNHVEPAVRNESPSARTLTEGDLSDIALRVHESGAVSFGERAELAFDLLWVKVVK